jgi:hypothetical protein
VDKLAIAARRARVVALRDAAADMVRLQGRGVGNIERDRHVTRIMMLDRGRLRIELWEPRHPTGIDRREKK